MNSLNILSARVSPPQTPSPSRSNSFGNIFSSATGTESRRNSQEDILEEKAEYPCDNPEGEQEDVRIVHEETPLLDKEASEVKDPEVAGWRKIPQRISFALIESIRWFLSTLAAPGVYLFACLCDEHGNFAPFSQMKNLGTRRASTAHAIGNSSTADGQQGEQSRGKSSGKRASTKGKKGFSSYSSSSGLSSESESDRDRSMSEAEHSTLSGTARHSRSKSLQASDEVAPARRSIRIKLHNEDSVRQRKHRKSQSTSTQSNGSGAIAANEISPATLKSPTSPASSLSMTKYPRAPAPPRPLIPRRQPSYTVDAPSGKLAQKTLILDLDETLIHSMAKGGRMSTGHMVEVKLNTVVGAGGNAVPGPQHPILYYVHKRPHCDDFLRRICKWYNLVIFTASVQEYADPVIDFLETERKFFSGRYYRQHCTYRHGAFIKDLSSVEPDLSKVMILDNSPLSYMFHQDNAIPIEGWISDPTDNDLMHLVPLLEGLQYVTDVRAFLALRGGEDGKHIA
ncbi:Nuclear envelope morphology protein 1 [Cadophora gregata]|uniref:Nuclear envelope morphology protein 1 n=1 Tax=Cadophora gregata TaxID=51156 RepID=UPI0026DC2CFD|nr:Nuclear envelope morphology protein 1 [Cadophora gregata]KAK0106999.1 Nuclear envelope morphology protein 1 [Cadophora gregata]KAK0116690.1 Nuclear envelope morphology protein 1 [Cadophora gregata f. sp. sojae]